MDSDKDEDVVTFDEKTDEKKEVFTAEEQTREIVPVEKTDQVLNKVIVIQPKTEKKDGESEAGALYRKARAKFDLEEYEEAIQGCTKALELKIYYLPAYVVRGAAFFKLEKLAEAIQDFTKAVELDKEFKIAYFRRGDAYRELGKFAEAIQDFTKAIELDKEYKIAYFCRGDAYNSLGKFAEAIQDFTKTIELNKEFKTAYLFRGDAYNSLEKFAEAIQDFTKAIELDKEYKIAYLKRGVAYRELGKFAEAIQDFTKAMEHEDVKFVRRMCQLKSKEFFRKSFQVPVSTEIQIEGNSANGIAQAFIVGKTLFGKKKVKIFDGGFKNGRVDGKGTVFPRGKVKQWKGLWKNGVLFKKILKVESREVNLQNIVLSNENLLGSGGFSFLYEVKYQRKSKAYKLFTHKYQTDFYCKIFVRMLEMVYPLVHKNLNIPLVHSLNFEDKRMGFIADLGIVTIENMIIKSRRNGIAMPFSLKLRVLLGVVEGMKYLHHDELRIIHRDLKWENVMLFGDNNIRIIDFGESKTLVRSTNTYRRGSPWHIAPEILKIVSGKVHYSTKADVFSFSIMIYALYFDVLSTTRNENGVYELEKLFYENEKSFALDMTVRPKIDMKGVKKGEEWIVQLMWRCWDDNPKKRPSFSEISDFIRSKLSKTMKKEIETLDLLKFYEKIK